MIDFILKYTAIIKHKPVTGNHCTIDEFTYISTRLIMGDYVHIAPFVSVVGGDKCTLIMGHFSGISAGGRIICGSDDFTQGLTNPMVPVEHRVIKETDVVLEMFALVGTNSVVLPGVTMREGSVLGANSLLTKDTEEWGIYVGSPAKLIKYRDKELILKGAKELGYEL
jgi:acetyltransferase-like isoleucine patch superfamily enzyme